MPVSNEAISALFKYLGGQGYRRPAGWDPSLISKAEIFAAWRHTFRAVTAADMLAAAAVYVAAGNTWWPNAGQLIALIPPSGPPMLGWARIWDRVCTGLRNKGRDKPPGRPDGWRLAERDDENEAAMVALGGENGWRRLCMSEEAKLGFEARTFERTFNAQLKTATAARRWIAASAPLMLPDTGASS